MLPDGKENASHPGDIRCPIPCFAVFPKMLKKKNCDGLFYVALTRAQKHLPISYAAFKADGKPTEPSMFIAEIQEEHDIRRQEVRIPEDIVTEFRVLEFADLQSPEIDKIEKEVMSPLRRQFCDECICAEQLPALPAGILF